MSEAARPPTVRRRSSPTSDLHRPWPLILAFLAPALLLYGLFFMYPMARAVYLSLFEGQPASSTFKYIGASNYRKLLFDDANFRNALSHNLRMILVAGSTTVVAAMFLAVGLTRIGRGTNVLRVVFLFPNVMPAVATALLWSFIFNPSFGIINAFLRGIGLEEYAHAWLGEPKFALSALMLVQVWAGVGFYVMLFHAGILGIPRDYLDAAKIDGASGMQEFRHVIFPLLGEILKIAIIYIVVNSLNIFSLVFLVTEGNADRHVDVVMTYLYEQAFQNGKFGYACAIGVAQLLILLGLAGLASRLLRHLAPAP